MPPIFAERPDPDRPADQHLTASPLAIDGNGFSFSTVQLVDFSQRHLDDGEWQRCHHSERCRERHYGQLDFRYGWFDLALRKPLPARAANLIYQYYAIAPNALSADAITVNFAGATLISQTSMHSALAARIRPPRSIPMPRCLRPQQLDGLGDHQQCERFNICGLSFWQRREPERGLWLDRHQCGSGDYYLSEYQIVSATQAGLVATAFRRRMRTEGSSTPLWRRRRRPARQFHRCQQPPATMIPARC